MMSELLEIDGSVLEGGGQILRNAISLSAILSIPVKVTKIRAGRTKPGLAAQHLKGIELVASMCNAKLSGACIGSTEIVFTPGKLQRGKYVADIKTAGSISLLLQVSLPCALLSPGAITLELYGGTNAEMAPQIDYMSEVFAYLLRRFNADLQLTVHRRGYFPKGGGHVTAVIQPVRELKSVEMTQRGDVTHIQGWSYVAGVLPLTMAQEQTAGAKAALRGLDVQIDTYKENPEQAPGNCNGIILVCESSTGCVLGSDALGKRGVSPRELGAQAGASLYNTLASGACVDDHAQDQLIIYMALASGRSVVRAGVITQHTRTAIYIAELMAKVTFTIEADGDQNLIFCTGLGIINSFSA